MSTNNPYANHAKNPYLNNANNANKVNVQGQPVPNGVPIQGQPINNLGTPMPNPMNLGRPITNNIPGAINPLAHNVSKPTINTAAPMTQAKPAINPTAQQVKPASNNTAAQPKTPANNADTSMYSNYSTNKFYTASKEELTLMLYDGALKFLNQAITAVDNKDVMKAHNSILRVQDIIRELQLSLNMSYPISKDFMNLYVYMHSQLVKANMRKDKKILEEVKGYATSFRDTWKEAMKLAKTQNQDKPTTMKTANLEV